MSNKYTKKNKKNRSLFIIPVSNTQAYKQFGNAVSVNVVKAILETLCKSQ